MALGGKSGTARLEDRFDLGVERVFLTGTQALIRALLIQKERDRRAGLSTGGYVTGYRGSPLGGLDQQFGRMSADLEKNDIVFRTALNEDLAATALWGTQQAEMRGHGRYDGVFGVWYGKGPGVDRSGDAFKHANLAGTSPNGGVLALMGDDHTCESSTTAHQSEFAFVDAMIPVLSPAGVQELIDHMIVGWQLSRFAGVWAGIKCVKDTVESTAVVDGRVERIGPRPAIDFAPPPGGLHIRPADHPLVQEERLHRVKLPAVSAFLAAAALDRVTLSGGRTPRIGIVSVGKSYLDVLQALDDLGIDEVAAARHGLALYKIACSWPLEASGLRRFAAGLELLIVVEEKRGLIEDQAKAILYGTANAPRIVGKRDEEGRPLFQSHGALDPQEIAVAIAERLLARQPSSELERRVEELRRVTAAARAEAAIATRIPYFCPGCPHNTSTHVPSGHRAYAGIGCHYMSQWMDRNTEGYTQMGGEGANWIGEAPFSNTTHVFQNIGDGTYNHSGHLAIRAAAAAKVNVTYKILYNDAVAMTGGQRHDGDLTVDAIARQVAAEGARKVAIVTDEPAKYPSGIAWPPFTTFHHRDDLDAVQRDLAAIPGLTVLIYDQTCAAEKRRRRKRGTFPDPDKRVIINDLVCEGCGDCGVQSNCVAVEPLETEFGRKRRIDQSACNKDFSCVKGFCPSFVTVHGAKRKTGTTGTTAANVLGELPEPVVAPLDGVVSILIDGVGGTGVVTIGAILGQAAHMEGKGAAIIDMAGLAQKGGAVVTHLKIAPRPEDIAAIRVGAGSADLVLGCDLVVTGGPKMLGAMAKGRTSVVVNTKETITGDFTRDVDYSLPAQRLMRAIRDRAGADRVTAADATRLATALVGDAIGANMFVLGIALQKGLIPVGRAAVEAAIRLNGAAVKLNLDALAWGRAYARDPAAVEAAARGPEAEALPHRTPAESLEAMIERRAAFLEAYQDRLYADRYRAAVATLRLAETRAAPGADTVTRAGARGLFKLMAIKDEYEVARLYTDGGFEKQLAAEFASWGKLEFHLAPPLLARPDPATGRPRKRVYGPWMLTVFRLLARMKGLRGTALDLFGRTAERRMERRLRDDYLALLGEVAEHLGPGNHAAAAALLAYPETIRGYGPVKEKAVEKAEADKARALAAFRAPTPAPLATAAE